MHLLNRYSLATGLKIDKPFILDKFFPIDCEKYITVHFNSKPSKTYDHAQEVVDILYSILSKYNISIIQVGGKDELSLSKCTNISGQTTINQLAYVIKNSLLHVGVDSVPAHFAGYYDIPLVALYSNNYIECCKPAWGDKNKQILLEPRRVNLKPSFSFEESPKTINTITPESIVECACKLLNIIYNYQYKTILTGDLYKTKILETVPNHVVNPNQFNTNYLSIRMDYYFNENNLDKQLSICPCAIITNKPIDSNLILKHRQNIIEIIYLIEEQNEPRFIEFLLNNNIKYNMVSFLEDNKISQLKLKYMQFGLIIQKKIIKPIEILNRYQNIYYKSGKFTLSDGKIFNSYIAFKKNIPNDINNEINQIIDEPEFWKEIEYFSLLIK